MFSHFPLFSQDLFLMIGLWVFDMTKKDPFCLWLKGIFKVYTVWCQWIYAPMWWVFFFKGHLEQSSFQVWILIVVSVIVVSVVVSIVINFGCNVEKGVNRFKNILSKFPDSLLYFYGAFFQQGNSCVCFVFFAFLFVCFKYACRRSATQQSRMFVQLTFLLHTFRKPNQAAHTLACFGVHHWVLVVGGCYSHSKLHVSMRFA